MHCDLKPANLLLDDEDHVRVMDFGHSRILTASAGTLGTFFYMAPEQTLLLDPGRQLQPDLRWDVFAVGASFFALLSGRTPWGRLSPQLDALPHLHDKLSLLRQTIHDKPLPDLYRLSKGRVDRDLSAIVAKCCEDDPAKRYSNVNEILADLQARRQGLPVSPLMRDELYRLGKLLKRNKSAVAVAGLGLTLMLGVAGYGAVQSRHHLQAQVAQLYSLRAAERARAGDPLAAAAYEAAAYDASPSQASAWNLQYYLPLPPQAIFKLRGSPPPFFTPDGDKLLALRKDGDLALLDLKAGETERLFSASGGISLARLSPSGAWVATAAQAGPLQVWDLKSGRVLASFRPPEAASALAWSPDGQRLAAAGAGGKLQVFGLSGKLLPSAPFQLSGAARWLEFSPDGSALLSLSRYRNGGEIVELIDPQEKPQRRLQLAMPGEGAVARFIGKGEGAVVLGPSGGAWLLGRQHTFWVGGTWALLETLKAPALAPRWAGLSADGRYLGRVENGGQLRVWSFEGAASARPLHVGIRGPFKWAAFAPVGPGLATLTRDGELRLWNLAMHRATGKTFLPERGATKVEMTGPERALVFSPPFVRQWDLIKGEPVGRPLHCDAGQKTLAGPQGRWLLQFPEDTGGDLLAFKAAQPGSYPMDFPYRSQAAQPQGWSGLSPNGKRLLTLAGSRGRFWDLDSGKPLGDEIRSETGLSGAWFNLEGDRALLQSGDRDGQLYDLRQGADPIALAGSGAPVAAAFSPDGTLATLDGQGRLAFWDSATGKALPPKTPPPPIPGGLDLAYSANGRLLRCLSKHSLLNLDPKTGAPLKHVDLPVNYERFQFSPDGDAFIALFGGELRLWDAKTGTALGSPTLLEAEPASVALSADHQVIAVGFKDGGFRLLDAASGRPLGDRFPGSGSTRSIAFSHDGRQLLAGSDSGQHRLWTLPWLRRKAPSHLALRAEAATGLRLDQDGSPQALAYSDWKQAWRRSREDLP
jgi:WD40 repeat protein